MVWLQLTQIKALRNKTKVLKRVVDENIDINIETVTALSNIDSIIDTFEGVVHGIVFGRVDFTLSANLSRNQILDPFVCDAAIKVSSICKEHNLEFVLGGGVSVDSIDFLRELSDIRLDRFETRKCILDTAVLFKPNITNILQNCVLAELLWLKSKSSSYLQASNEDQQNARTHLPIHTNVFFNTF